MTRPFHFSLLVALFALNLTVTPGFAQDKPAAPPASIQLLPPKLETGTTVLKAISQRHSSRAFDPAPLDLQQLSEVLWAAGGVNRPQSQGIVIPTAMGAKDLDVYALLPDGIYFYDPQQHRLNLVTSGDHRAQAGKQAFAAQAPLNLFFVADEARMRAKDPEARKRFGAMTAAYASENVYLYCASAGLSTVARGAFDADALAKLLKLKPSQQLYLGQSVGRAIASR